MILFVDNKVKAKGYLGSGVYLIQQYCVPPMTCPLTDFLLEESNLYDNVGYFLLLLQM